jgi:Polysaccharide lyase
MVQRVAPDRISILADQNARQGRRYARVTVRPGDNPLSCCQNTERAEVLYMQDANNRPIFENTNSGTQQYAFSVKFDPTWKTIVDNGYGDWGIFLQLHGPDDLGANVAWAFSATDHIVFIQRAGDVSKNPLKGYELANGSLNKGKWIDFILTVKYAMNNTGFVTVERRDEGESSFKEVLNLRNIPTLQFSSQATTAGVHYVKSGLYRNKQSFTSILYLDGFTRAAVTTGQ